MTQLEDVPVPILKMAPFDIKLGYFSFQSTIFKISGRVGTYRKMPELFFDYRLYPDPYKTSADPKPESVTVCNYPTLSKTLKHTFFEHVPVVILIRTPGLLPLLLSLQFSYCQYLFNI